VKLSDIYLIPQCTFSQLLQGLILLLRVAADEGVTSSETADADHLKFQNVVVNQLLQSSFPFQSTKVKRGITMHHKLFEINMLCIFG